MANVVTLTGNRRSHFTHLRHVGKLVSRIFNVSLDMVHATRLYIPHCKDDSMRCGHSWFSVNGLYLFLSNFVDGKQEWKIF